MLNFFKINSVIINSLKLETKKVIKKEIYNRYNNKNNFYNKVGIKYFQNKNNKNDDINKNEKKEEKIKIIQTDKEEIIEKTNATTSNGIEAFNSLSKEKTQKASIREIYHYFKPYFTSGNAKRLLIYSIILTIISKGLISMSPYFLKLTINSVLDKHSLTASLILLALSGLSRTSGTFVQEYRQILLNTMSSKAMVSFSKDLMNYLMKLNYSIFKNNSETVVHTFSRSLQGLDRLNRFVIGNVMSNVVELIIISFMLHTLLGPKYFFNTFITYAIYFGVTRYLSSKRQVVIREKFKAEVNSENKINDIVFNIDTVKYFQREEKESENFSNIIQGVRNQDHEVIKSLSKLNSCQNLIITLGVTINLGMGICDCFNGTMTPGDLIMLQAIFAQIMMPLNFMGILMREIDETRVNLHYAIDMINDKEKMKKENQEKNKSEILFNFKQGKIEFKDLTFGHTPQKLIFNNLNAVFEPGTMNAIVGYSGQGKSTLFHLLYRFYEPNSGKILVDDQNIADVNLDSFRKHLTICPQNGHLFNETILHNILYGNIDATPGEVEKITQEVNLFKKINSLSDKFETNVGTLGSKLSGGEKQRLLLARTFIRSSDIVLLDEPTSNLDNNNENIIMNYIKQKKKNKTILITAHRFSTISNCDMIYVLNKGKFAEVGTHDQLMQIQNGIYYDMFTKHILK